MNPRLARLVKNAERRGPKGAFEVRPARGRDVAAIAAMRTAYYGRLALPVPPITTSAWLVAERDGRVLAACSTRDLPPDFRYVADMLRDEALPTSLFAFQVLGRELCRRAEVDGMRLMSAVARQNFEYEELLNATGEWEPVSTTYEWTGWKGGPPGE